MHRFRIFCHFTMSVVVLFFSLFILISFVTQNLCRANIETWTLLPLVGLLLTTAFLHPPTYIYKYCIKFLYMCKYISKKVELLCVSKKIQPISIFLSGCVCFCVHWISEQMAQKCIKLLFLVEKKFLNETIRCFFVFDIK